MLRKEEAESLLQANTLAGVLAVGREASRMSRMGGVSIRRELLQGVNSLALLVQIVHQMHRA